MVKYIIEPILEFVVALSKYLWGALKRSVRVVGSSLLYGINYLLKK